MASVTLPESFTAPNNVLTSHRSTALSLNAQKVELLMLKNFDNTEVVELEYKNILRCGVPKRNYPLSIKRIYEELKSITLDLKNKNGARIFTSLASSFVINPENKNVTFRMDPNLIPFLTEIKENYCKLSFTIAVGLNDCLFSPALYRILETSLHSLQVGDSYPVTIKDRDLRKSLGLITIKDKKEIHKYAKPYHFEKNVLKPAIAELNKDSNMHVSYTRETAGKKVIAYTFTLKRQMWEPQFDFMSEDDEGGIPAIILEMLDKMSFKCAGKSEIWLQGICDEYDDEYIIEAIETLDADYKGQTENVRGGIVKNQLEKYILKARDKQQQKDRIKEIIMDEDKKDKAIDIYVNRLKNSIEEYIMLNDCTPLLDDMPGFLKGNNEQEKHWVESKVSAMIVEKIGSQADFVKTVAEK